VDSGQLIAALAWSSMVLGAALIGMLIWFARRMISQIDRLTEVVRQASHDFDKRVSRLEDWRSTQENLLQRRPFGDIEP